MSDPSVPDVLAASDLFWTQLRREDRGDENVGHVSDVKECNIAVWLRRSGLPAQALSPRTFRMFELGHEAERTEALAIGEGLKPEGWTLERGVLYWLGHEAVARTGPAADLPIEQHDEQSGLIGGRLPLLYRECRSCEHLDTEHDHLTSACRSCATCPSGYLPKTALLGDSVLVGHGDLTLTKAWVSTVIDAKSKAFVKKDDAANPRWDYVLQCRAYGFAQGAKLFGILQIDRGSASTTLQYFTTRDPGELRKLAELVKDRLEHTRAGTPQPRLFNALEGAPPKPDVTPHKWSCQKGREGDAYCRWALCSRHPDYVAAGLEIVE